MKLPEGMSPFVFVDRLVNWNHFSLSFDAAISTFVISALACEIEYGECSTVMNSF